MAGLSGSNDNIRYYRWDNGRAKPVLPNYTSQNYINSDMSLDEAISTLDQVLAEKQHNSLVGLQGGSPGQYYHVNQNIHDSLIGYEGYNPSPDNPFATVNWVNSKITNASTKVSWGYANYDAAPGNYDDNVTWSWDIYIDFTIPSISHGAIAVYPSEGWTGFQENAGFLMGGGEHWQQAATDPHGWNVYYDEQEDGSWPNRIKLTFSKMDIQYLRVTYFLAVGY